MGAWVLYGLGTENNNLPGYVVASLTGQFQLSRNLQLNARVENLLDADYQTAAQFTMQGRSMFLELKYRRP